MNSTARILIVDDHPEILLLFSKILRMKGYEVFQASTGEEALRCAREQRPDLVLLDVVLPDISGIQVCRQIKTDPALIDTFVVLVSGEAISVTEKVDGLEIGADDYIAKPLPMPEFLARVRTVMRLRDTTVALRASEQHYRRLVEILPDAIGITDNKGRLTAVNQQTLSMLGYDSTDELLETGAIIAPEDWPRFAKDIGKILEKGSMRNAEYTAKRRDGTRFPVELSATVSVDAKGTSTGLVIVARDITERKWTENLLQAQRDFGTFLGSTSDLDAILQRLLHIALESEGVVCGWVSLFDVESGVASIAAFEGMSQALASRLAKMEVAPATLIAEEPAQPQPTSDQQQPLSEELKAEGIHSLKVIPIRHGKDVVAVLSLGSHLEAVPTRSCKALEAIASQAGDAIARIRVERSLQTSRQLVEKTIHSIRAAFFVIDAKKTTILDCNPAASRIFGYTRAELIGKPCSALHLHDASFEQMKQHLHTALAEKGFLNDFEIEMRRKDGKTFPTEHSTVPMINEKGEVVSWVSIIRDITARKRAEEELRQFPKRIIEAQESERLRVARELHDGVNQVIASAKLRLCKVEESLSGKISPAAREMLARCHRQLVEALEENRRIAHNLRPSDLDELGLAEASSSFCDQFKLRSNLEVSCDVSSLVRRFSPEVELNLFRIVQEALTNAEKHAQAKSVHVCIEDKGDTIKLTVQDDGCGFTATETRAKKGKSRGIGLKNMHERAASIGGTCQFKSKKGQGTTIVVTAPITAK